MASTVVIQQPKIQQQFVLQKILKNTLFMKLTEKLENFVLLFFFQVVTGTAGMSLGASGALFTILGIYGTLMPESEWSIIFLPMFSFTAENGIKGE